MCRSQIAKLHAEGLFTPPSEQGTLFYPFTGGGANWGSASFDPMRNLLVVNMNNLAHNIQLIPSDQVEATKKVFHDQEVTAQTGAPFGMRRSLVTSPFGIPCNRPPWGILAAVNIDTGKIVWRRALGALYGINLGLPGVGGTIVTAGGLVFVGATMDNMFRAFDVETGDLLWDWELPAAGQATPMTYVWNDRQYVVIYAGGNSRAVGDLGDSVIAFALETN
jgi:quinoprotein glucose dehydrogenase